MKTAINKKVLPYIFKSSHLIVLFFFFFSSQLNAQSSLLEQRISIEAYNKPLIEVLNEVRDRANLKLMFSSSTIPTSHLVSIRATNKTVKEIFEELFNDIDLEFKVVNEQIIIYKKKIVLEEDTSMGSKYGSRTKYVTIYDTVITEKFDTIVHMSYDTIKIMQYDTVVVFDTLFRVEKLSFTKSIDYSLDFSFSSFQNLDQYAKYPKAGFPSNYSLDGLYNIPVWNYTLGSTLNMEYRDWVLQTGLNISYIKENINFTSYRQDIFYDSIAQYNLNTVTSRDSTFYEIQVSPTKWDTVWSFQDSSYTYFDTTYISANDTNYLGNPSNISNKFIYAEIPLIIGHNFYFKTGFKCRVDLGLIAGFLISGNNKNIYYTSNAYQQVSLNRKVYSPLVFSLYGALDLEQKISRDWSAFAGFIFRKSISPISSGNYLISPKISSYGVKVGLRKYF